MRVIIDTNIFVMSYSSTSLHHAIYQYLRQNKYTLCLTNSILYEYEEIMTKKYGIAAARAFLLVLDVLPNVEYIDTFFNFTVITTDPDDNKFVDCAIASNADFIITNDNHFSILKSIPFPKVEILDINEFLKILEITI